MVGSIKNFTGQRVEVSNGMTEKKVQHEKPAASIPSVLSEPKVDAVLTSKSKEVLKVMAENPSINMETVDKKFPKFLSNRKNRETVKGINLGDILIIKNWLLFAKLIGDNSYKKITNDNLMNANIEKQFSNKIKSINNN